MTTSRIRDKHLSCSICFELYTSPKTLPCLHSFCETCLENHMRAKKVRKGFECPMCNTYIQLPDPSAPPQEWTSQFKTDFKLQGMMEEIMNIERDRKVVKDISHLGTVIGELRENEQSLLDKIETDKDELIKVNQEQQDLTQQISDVFATVRLKLQRKEQAMKQRATQMTNQRKDTVSRSWLTKQKLIDQTNTLIGEGEELRASGAKNKRREVQLFQDSLSNLKVAFSNISDVQLPVLELDMRNGDMIKFDSLKFCDIGQEKGEPVEPVLQSTSKKPVAAPGKGPAPPVPVEPKAVIIASSQTVAKTVTTVAPAVGRPQSATQSIVISQKPQLIAVLNPVLNGMDKDPDFQDVIVLRESNIQIVVASDFTNKTVVAIYVKQGSKTQMSLKLDGNPARLCKLDSSRVGVSVNNPYKVVILSVYPELKLLSTVKTNINNVGIAALNPSTLALSVKNKVCVITTAGVVLKEFNIKAESAYHAMSWYVAVTPTGSIIVADKCGETVSCLTPTGQTLWQWKTPESAQPSGVACDQQGAVHVVLGERREIHKLSETGQHLGVVLNQENGLDMPSGMCIDQFGQWYVLKRARQIQIFKR